MIARYLLIGVIALVGCSRVGDAVGNAGFPKVPAPTEPSPIMAGIAFVHERQSRDDETTLMIRIRIAPGWHALPKMDTEGGVRPPELEEPRGLEPAGPWLLPSTMPGPNGPQCESEMIFKRKFRIIPGTRQDQGKIKAEIRIQACNDRICLPPRTIALETALRSE